MFLTQSTYFAVSVPVWSGYRLEPKHTVVAQLDKKIIAIRQAVDLAIINKKGVAK